MSRRGRPWSSDDEACAAFLCHCGMSNESIGKILHRSTKSVQGKIGYQRTRTHVVIYTRPIMLGRMERRS
jgi:hypothetical protein